MGNILGRTKSEDASDGAETFGQETASAAQSRSCPLEGGQADGSAQEREAASSSADSGLRNVTEEVLK